MLTSKPELPPSVMTPKLEVSILGYLETGVKGKYRERQAGGGRRQHMCVSVCVCVCVCVVGQMVTTTGVAVENRHTHEDHVTRNVCPASSSHHCRSNSTSSHSRLRASPLQTPLSMRNSTNERTYRSAA